MKRKVRVKECDKEKSARRKSTSKKENDIRKHNFYEYRLQMRNEKRSNMTSFSILFNIFTNSAVQKINIQTYIMIDSIIAMYFSSKFP